MKPVRKKKSKRTAKKQAPVPVPFLEDMTYLELKAAKELYYSSRIIHYLEEVIEAVDGIRPLSKVEQQAMDLIIERYNVRYKSPLAMALSETKDGKN